MLQRKTPRKFIQNDIVSADINRNLFPESFYEFYIHLDFPNIKVIILKPPSYREQSPSKPRPLDWTVVWIPVSSLNGVPNLCLWVLL